MKNIIKYFALFSIILTMVSCDEKEWLAPDIELTSVYSITNITNLGVVKINVYKQKPLIVEYVTNVNPKNYTSSGFVDSSTDTTIEIAFNKVVEGGQVSYAVFADKATGVGSITVNGTSVYTIKISEIEVYN